MRIGQGVEWAAHACALLAAVPDGMCLSGSALAAFHDLPAAYMAKHLQALARQGLLRSLRGAQGGYQLARPASEITLLDIETAILGQEPRFVCQNIRLRGPCAAPSSAAIPCEIACAFWAAERAYRTALEGTTIADVARSVGARRRGLGDDGIRAWIMANATGPER